MDYSRLIVIVIRLLFITSEALAAAGVFVYPGKGQTRISRNRTSSVATNGRKSKPDLIRTNRCSKRLLPAAGRRSGGAARGAAIGAVGGAIGGDAGKGGHWSGSWRSGRCRASATSRATTRRRPAKSEARVQC